MKRRPHGAPLLRADNFFMLRIPLLPWEIYRDLAGVGDGERGGTGGGDGWTAERYRRSCRNVRHRLAKIVEDPVFLEALAVSSPDLLRDLEHWHRDPLSDRGAALERGLLKYVTRASTRCTPFGLLAGVALGKVVETGTTTLCLEGRQGLRRHVRVDARVVLALAALLADEPAVRPHLTYYPNSTLYRLGPWYRYYEGRGHPYGGNFRLVSVLATPLVENLVTAARGGAPWDRLASVVGGQEPECGREEVEEFLVDVVSSQLLVPDIYPPAQGAEMLDYLERKLTGVPVPARFRDLLNRLHRHQRSLAVAPPGAGRDALVAAVAAVNRFLDGERFRDRASNALVGREEAGGMEDTVVKAAAATRVGDCFQVDMTVGGNDLYLGAADLTPILPVLESLYHLSVREHRRPLAEFVEVFTRQYGEREVPLCEVLDPDHGIRFGGPARRQSPPSPLLRLPVGVTGNGHLPEVRAALDTWRAELVTAAAREGRGTIRLHSDAICRRFAAAGGPPPPLSVAVMLSRLAGAEGARWLLVGSHGGHALVLLGRFAHVLGPALTRRLRRLAEHEQLGASADLAEVAYLPPSRLGNVCQHPQLRRRTIPYASPPPYGDSEVVPPDDLLVSVRHGRVVLRSRQGGGRIEPRIDHALNIAHPTNPAVFHFLGLLQYQGVHAGLGWSWGGLSGLPFLPRVVVDEVVVAPRTWNLSNADVADLTEGLDRRSCELTGWPAFRRLQRWRHEHGVPRLVALGGWTDYFVADLENPLAADLFLRLIRRQRRVRETFLAERAAAVTVKGEGGRVHEMVVPLWNAAAEKAAAKRPPRPSLDGRSRHQGTDGVGDPALGVTDGVLYARLYGGERALDALLRGSLGSALAEWRREGLFHDWFFVRYADPDHHLRLRLFGEPARLGGDLLPRLERFCRDQGATVRRLVVDSYRPETDRYGGPAGLILAHRFFCLDSRFVLALIRRRLPPAGEEAALGDARWLLAAASVDCLLAGLGMTPDARLRFVTDYGAALAREYGIETQQQRVLGRFFRNVRSTLDAIVGNGGGGGRFLGKGTIRLLADREHRLAIWFARMERLIARGDLTRPWPEVRTSLVHMHCNRLFGGHPRRQEAMLLQLLRRTYTMQIKRDAGGKRGREAVS